MTTLNPRRSVFPFTPSPLLPLSVVPPRPPFLFPPPQHGLGSPPLLSESSSGPPPNSYEVLALYAHNECLARTRYEKKIKNMKNLSCLSNLCVNAEVLSCSHKTLLAFVCFCLSSKKGGKSNYIHNVCTLEHDEKTCCETFFIALCHFQASDAE